MRFRHVVVPSRVNHYHPVALRPIGLFMVALILALIPFVYNVSAAHRPQVLGYATSISIGDLSAISNNERRAAGLGDLALNATLNNAAAAKAQDMFAKDYWAHNAPDGRTPWDFMIAAGYQYSTAGENLAMGFNTSAEVVAGWMNSPGHKANILNTTYHDAGYAVMNGTLQGQQTTLVVAMYGSTYTPPAPAPAAAPVAPQSQPPAPVEQEAPPTESVPVEATPTDAESAKPATAIPEPKQETIATTDKGLQASVAGLSVSLPIKVYTSLNWGQKASILLVSSLMTLFVMKHTMIWRQQRGSLKGVWLRAHPIGQLSILTVALIATIASGTGTIL